MQARRGVLEEIMATARKVLRATLAILLPVAMA
jgi:hypothetical protein